MLENLNQEQQEAVRTIEGPLLVLAGAGSGKTRVVTFRIVHLLEVGIAPSQILGLTFTNKAAEEMRHRVHQMTDQNVLICTFHSLGARILRESIHHLGYNRHFTIYDQEDAEKVLGICIEELNLAQKKLDVKAFKHLISHAKNDCITPEEAHIDHPTSEIEELFPKVYKHYQEKLAHFNAVDFDDLIFLTAILFQKFPEVLSHFQNRWSFLLIDEYQDTNASQYALVKMLVDGKHNICVVGDPDQSIYSWRGAKVQNILNFERDFSGTKVIRLEQNYRSRSNILNAANALVQNNDMRFEKNLWSDRGPGDKIKFYSADDSEDEVKFVADRMLQHHNQNIPLNQMVIFYRTNFQSRVFEDYFLLKRIPYVIVGSISFYQRKEIKDILAFLRMVQSGNDYISFARTINIPRRGIGEATIEKIMQHAAAENLSLFAYCEAIVDEAPLQEKLRLTQNQKKGLVDYVAVLRLLKRMSHEVSLKDLVQAAIRQTHYLDSIKDDKDTFDDRKGNLDDLVAKANEWEMKAPEPNLSAFLEDLSLKSSLDQADTTKDRVNLMTIHNGKGLEFTVTFIVGLEEQLFPHINSMQNTAQLEEERRLCYVGMTRAKEYLYMTHAHARFLWGARRDQRQSRFMREVPLEYVEKIRRSFSFMPQKPLKEEVSFIDDMDQSIPEGIENEQFEEGDFVFHKDFGPGLIKQTYQGAAGLTYKIHFSKENRERNIVAKYSAMKRL